MWLLLPVHTLFRSNLVFWPNGCTVVLLSYDKMRSDAYSAYIMQIRFRDGKYHRSEFGRYKNGNVYA